MVRPVPADGAQRGAMMNSTCERVEARGAGQQSMSAVAVERLERTHIAVALLIEQATDRVDEVGREERPRDRIRQPRRLRLARHLARNRKRVEPPYSVDERVAPLERLPAPVAALCSELVALVLLCGNKLVAGRDTELEAVDALALKGGS